MQFGPINYNTQSELGAVGTGLARTSRRSALSLAGSANRPGRYPVAAAPGSDLKVISPVDQTASVLPATPALTTAQVKVNLNFVVGS